MIWTIEEAWRVFSKKKHSIFGYFLLDQIKADINEFVKAIIVIHSMIQVSSTE
jgi:hypothetical protein